MTKPNNILVLTLLAALAASTGDSLWAATPAKNTKGDAALPKVVVNILVDQLRSDYMEAFMPLYGEDGLKRLMREGRVYANAEYPIATIDRASATATLSTGTTPSNHGIVGRQWVDRDQLKPILCLADKAVQGVGTPDQYSAARLSTSTIGDELKVASDGKAVVISIAPDADAAIMQAGHAANGAYWLDDTTGQWVSSSYYAPAIPQWAKLRNSVLATSANQIVWEPSSPLVGNFSYFLSGGMKQPFKYVLKTPERFRQWKTSGLVNQEVAAAAENLLQLGSIGIDGITDYIALTFYAGGYEGRTAAEAPLEIQDTYVRLDAAIARVLSALDAKVGRDNVLLSFTSTGYTVETGSDLSRYRIPTGTFDLRRAVSLLGIYLRAVYGQGDLISTTYGTEIYLNHKTIEDHQINYSELLERCQDFLQQLAGVKDVYGSVRLLQGGWTPGLSRIRNNYHVQHSGDLTIEVMPGWRAVDATQKYEKLSRASYVPFPIVFFGYGIAAEKISDAVTVDYIAPTLTSAMRIRAPNACDKSPLF